MKLSQSSQSQASLSYSTVSPVWEWRRMAVVVASPDWPMQIQSSSPSHSVSDSSTDHSERFAAE